MYFPSGKWAVLDGTTSIALPQHQLHFTPRPILLHVHGKQVSRNQHIRVFWFHFDPFIGTEELGHLEMVGTIVHQLTRNLKDHQIKDSAFAPYFVDHTVGVYPTAASGSVWNSGMMQVKGDPIADLAEDMGADGTTLQRQRPKKSLRRNGFWHQSFWGVRPYKDNNQKFQ